MVEVHPDGRVETVWTNATVPFARVKDGQIELIAQATVHWPAVAGGHGEEDRRLPHVRRSTGGSTWSDPELIVADDRVRNCTSPVLVDFRELEYLFCVDEGGVPIPPPQVGDPLPAGGPSPAPPLPPGRPL